MSKNYFAALFLLVLSPLLFAAGDQEYGEGDRYEFNIGNFEGIEASAAFEVEVRQGDNFSVVVYADKQVKKRMIVEKRGRSLYLGIKPLSGILWGSSPSPKAIITMPILVSVDLSGASSMIAAGFSSEERLTCDLSGSSSLQIDIKASDATIEMSGASDLKAVLETGDVTLDLSGSSDIELVGYGDALRADFSGASSGRLDDFLIKEASLELSGSSDIHINLDGPLNLDASGASDLYYTGNVELRDIDVSGGSSMKRK